MAASDVSPSFVADRDTDDFRSRARASAHAGRRPPGDPRAGRPRARDRASRLSSPPALSGWSGPHMVALALGTGGVWFAASTPRSPRAGRRSTRSGPACRGRARGAARPGRDHRSRRLAPVAGVRHRHVADRRRRDPAARVGWETVVGRWLTPPTRLLVVGPRDPCTELIRELNVSDETRFQLVGVVDDALRRAEPRRTRARHDRRAAAHRHRGQARPRRARARLQPPGDLRAASSSPPRPASGCSSSRSSTSTRSAASPSAT